MLSLDGKRLPLASYDVVVYFGVGLLALPFVRYYMVKPLHLQPPPEAITFSSQPVVTSAVLALIVLFAGYALGHVIALLASYLIERFVITFLGYPAAVWLKTCDLVEEHKRDLTETEKRRLVYQTVQRANVRWRHLFLIAFHVPLFPLYAVLISLRWFDFYFSKLPFEIRSVLDDRLRVEKVPIAVAQGTPWPKVLKQYVVNNCPVAYARMSNHRVVFGLLRSLALLALCAAWVEIGLAIAAWIKGDSSALFHAVGWLTFAVLATFLIIGFAKFNRRFFEESVYAFVFKRGSDATNC